MSEEFKKTAFEMPTEDTLKGIRQDSETKKNRQCALKAALDTLQAALKAEQKQVECDEDEYTRI